MYLRTVGRCVEGFCFWVARRRLVERKHVDRGSVFGVWADGARMELGNRNGLMYRFASGVVGESRDSWKRTHHCGKLEALVVGSKVTVCGWVQSIRLLGGVTFLVVRDATGLIQIKFSKDDPNKLLSNEDEIVLHSLSLESVVSVTGTVALRPKEMVNTNMETGNIEIVLEKLVLLNKANELPYSLHNNPLSSEETRLRYRFLDLRRQLMQQRLQMRSLVNHTAREVLLDHGFIEVETPTLFTPTPEGAREFLVPSSKQKGKFYSLVQSPQQYKQLLMASGVDRYFQFARCYRDEDTRADRQPEFTQIDLEMSFITEEDIMSVIENLIKRIWETTNKRFPQWACSKVEIPFPRMTYNEAMARFGSDKPDLRFGLEICDLTNEIRQCNVGTNFQIFNQALKNKGVIKGLVVRGFTSSSNCTKGQMQLLNQVASVGEIKGVLPIEILPNGNWKSPISKFLSENDKNKLNERLIAHAQLDEKNLTKFQPGDLILLVAGNNYDCSNSLGRLRLHCAQRLMSWHLMPYPPPNLYRFFWVVDFPLFSPAENEADPRLTSTHHPFTAPNEQDLPFLFSNPAGVRGRHYDIVVNGVELGGGSIRVHDANLQKRIFSDILLLPHHMTQRFHHLLEALSLGAPPHGGIALGLDRLIAQLCAADSLREVIAFPKTAIGSDLLVGSPAVITSEELAPFHIQTVAKE